METPGFKEDNISEIPALQMLINLGCTYLKPAEAELYQNLITNLKIHDKANAFIAQNDKTE